jgi:prepilin-type N-terminal cleavage/methylation domain-containing protein
MINSRGFTLVELVVVVAIFAFMTTIVISNYGSFRNQSDLSDLSYQLALTIREAQSYGISAQAFDGSFDTPYGIYISSDNPTALYLFADANLDRQYEANELVSLFSLNNGNSIMDFSVTNGGQTWSQSGGSLSSLYIFFKRPNPDACIMTNLDENDCQIVGDSLVGGYQGATIILRDQNGDTNSISINSTGQVSISD